jgi:hypothetical protein
VLIKIPGTTAGPLLLCILITCSCVADIMAQHGAPIVPLALAAGPGSAEPRLSTGPGGIVVLSWLEPADGTTRLKFATLGTDGWSPPRSAAQGQNWLVNWADFPSVVPINASLWAAHWLSKRSGGVYAYDVSVAISRDGGLSWSDPITPHRDGTATEHGFVSLFPWRDGIGVVWLDGRNTQAQGKEQSLGGNGGMTLRSAVILADGSITAETELDGLVCDCCQTGAAVIRDGAIVVYRDRSSSEIRDIYAIRAQQDHWLAGRPVAEDGWKIEGCPVNGPAIAAINDDVAVAWFTAAGGQPRVRLARSHDGGLTFSDTQDIDRDLPIGRVDVAFLSNGRLAVSWLDSDARQQAEIKVQIIARDGRPGALYVIAQTLATRPAGFPQLAADGESLVVAWTDAEGEQSRVRTARLRPIAAYGAAE